VQKQQESIISILISLELEVSIANHDSSYPWRQVRADWHINYRCCDNLYIISLESCPVSSIYSRDSSHRWHRYI